MEFRNAAYNRNNTIDAEVNHPVHGWIPMTLSPEDTPTSELYYEALENGPTEYRGLTSEELLAIERENMVVSRFQAKAALLQAGYLPQVKTLISMADDLTKLAFEETIEWHRNSNMVATLAGPDGLGLTETQVDDLFRAAAQIKV